MDTTTTEQIDLIELDDAELEQVHGGATTPSTRTFQIIAGNGGLAWFQLLWPQFSVAS